jgi:SpoVK/Ycf46/Vps4 family AAA+-type ATPase
MQVEPQPKEHRPLHVEVAVHALCPTSLVTLQTQWSEFLEKTEQPLALTSDCRQIDLRSLPAHLGESCLKASLCQDDRDDGVAVMSQGIPPKAHDFRVHVFYLSEEEVSTEEIEPDGGDDEWTAGCDSLTLPHVSLDGLWETLILEPRLKQRLLDYAQSALLFSDRAVSSHLVHWNRILLLHGVPGTGKTSLCRSLAHKLAIRMRHRFPQGATLLDVRAHSLFSKWFSTSGKLVSSLFQMVRDMLQDDPNTLVCVLVDEVESLASTRNSPGTSGDPSDAMRAVNSLLTSLDRLRSFPNVLVLATTNLTGSVDAAFVDRVDLKIHIGLPILKARYEILKSCTEELQRVGIVEESSSSDASSTIATFDQQQQWNGNSNAVTKMMLECAQGAEGLSGRSLRRLPLQAHAQFLGGMERVSVEEFVQALGDAIRLEQTSRTKV